MKNRFKTYYIQIFLFNLYLDYIYSTSLYSKDNYKLIIKKMF